ncbi:gamma-glutamyltransferase family protein [Arvimicrobium flavum]|uniref:gamma-glutamyltransferase family protein n=1 Tax=Arvimicrobium flavum TaxID=3393320 RepID=UPI00237B79C0|nr:gamma-glutamyltransferase family protein [Mesorhizobium shangrilense]
MRAFDRPGRSAVYAENGMAATSHPLATAVALDVLKGGGNAADAAVAASATLCVVEPHMTGIGGDCLAIVAEPDGSVHALNGSGRAPAAASGERYRALGLREVPETGALGVTAPGALKAWETLLHRFGTRGFDDLFRPAIRYAEDGFAIHPRVARDWPGYVADLSRDEGGSRHLLVDGRAPKVGERFRAPALASTLRIVARGGAKAFYEGEIAAEMAATIQAKGGFLSEQDLLQVTADWVDPISLSYGGHDIIEMPPNGQGITALILLGLMERIGVRTAAPDSVERYHLEIEAARLAYAVRDHLVGDPETMTVAPAAILSDAHLDALAGRIDPRRHNPDVALPELPDADTIYLTVVDRDRRAVSFINSVYSGFGSRVVTPRSGVTLQNRGACFTLEPGHPNELGPGKRPMHTIIPAMAMKDGRVAASFGVMGGAFQPMGHAHVLANMVDFSMDPQEAVDHPRLFWDKDGVLAVESGISESVRQGMIARGHQVRDAASPHGGGQIIAVDHESGFLIGGSDPRKDGLALGW